MSGRRGLLLAAVGALLLLGGAVALVGRGGGCGGGYPATPECVAEAYATRSDASKCDLVEQRLLEELTGARGTEARRRCARAVATQPPAKEVRILEREPTGRDAVMVELLTDGREGVVTVQRRDGRWRITSFDE